MQTASIFQDHMVLQRERPIPVWGQAEAGVKVTVSLAGTRTKAETTTGADGRWMAILPAQPAGGPLELTVKSGSHEILFQDVWVGEVWVGSGQSNMQMTVNASADAPREMAAANHPGIRVLTVNRVALTTRQEAVGGAWTVCTPETAGNFTAAGYYFARELHQKLGVAVGVIDSSWGGTMAEAWTSREGLQGDPSLKYFIDKLDRFLGPEGEEEREAAQKARDNWSSSIPTDPGNAGEKKGWHLPATADGDWKTMELPTGWQTAGHDFSGVFWFRRELTIPAEWAGRDLSLHVGACDKRDFTYFNGEFMGSMGVEDRPDAWCIPRVYVVPGRLVKAGRNVVAVRVFSNMYQGGMIGPDTEMWAAPDGAGVKGSIRLAGAWRYRVEQDFGKINTAPSPACYGDGNPNTPSVLFNGMIAPLLPYAIRGFIWYQGESNADRPAEYRTLFPAMIRDWRREWGREDLAFYFVQLANYMAVNEKPVESNWAQLREAQRFTLSVVPRTGMAVIIDIGEAGDIHPKNKQDVGRRLAACALASDYGKPEFVGSSPVPHSAKACGGTVTVTFDYAAGGLKVRGEKLTGFAVAGSDRKFFWAEAKVVGADGVALTCRDVAEPRWVRYAWSDNPVCNLYGGTELPASPFETALPCGPWMA
jgi:sialate O-acetylesterase